MYAEGGIWWPGNGVFALVLPKYDSFAELLQITFAKTISNPLASPGLFRKVPESDQSRKLHQLQCLGQCLVTRDLGGFWLENHSEYHRRETFRSQTFPNDTKPIGKGFPEPYAPFPDPQNHPERPKPQISARSSQMLE